MQRDRQANLHKTAEDREAERLQEIINFRVCNRKKKSKLISKCQRRGVKEPKWYFGWHFELNNKIKERYTHEYHRLKGKEL